MLASFKIQRSPAVQFTVSRNHQDRQFIWKSLPKRGLHVRETQRYHQELCSALKKEQGVLEEIVCPLISHLSELHEDNIRFEEVYVHR